MILPSWAFVTVLSIIFIILIYSITGMSRDKTNHLNFEDFFMSKEVDGIRRANPHKLAFIAAFIVTAWINVMIAPMIPSSDNALYYSIAFVIIFTISLLSKSTLTVLRDIAAIVWKRDRPKHSEDKEK